MKCSAAHNHMSGYIYWTYSTGSRILKEVVIVFGIFNRASYYGVVLEFNHIIISHIISCKSVFSDAQ
jgi:hypothetical protein